MKEGKGGWYVSIPASVSPTGKRQQVYFKDKKEAQKLEDRVKGAKEARAKLEIPTRRPQKPSEQRKVEGVLPWREALKMAQRIRWDGLQDSKTPAHRVTLVLSWVGKENLLDVSRADLLAYREYRLKKGIKPSTVNKELTTLSGLLQTVQEEAETDYGFPKVPLIPRKQMTRAAAQRRFLTKEELEDGLKVLRKGQWDDQRDLECAAFFECSYYLGCRRGEFLQATVADIQGGEGAPIIIFRKTKTGDTRAIPIAPKALEILQAQVKGKKKGDPIWDVSIAQLRHAWDKVRESMGWPSDNTVVPYSLRHGVATEILRKTGDLRAVQEWLGHQDISTTTIYAKVVPETLRNISEGL